MDGDYDYKLMIYCCFLYGDTNIKPELEIVQDRVEVICEDSFIHGWIHTNDQILHRITYQFYSDTSLIVPVWGNLVVVILLRIY